MNRSIRNWIEDNSLITAMHYPAITKLIEKVLEARMKQVNETIDNAFEDFWDDRNTLRSALDLEMRLAKEINRLPQPEIDSE